VIDVGRRRRKFKVGTDIPDRQKEDPEFPGVPWPGSIIARLKDWAIPFRKATPPKEIKPEGGALIHGVARREKPIKENTRSVTQEAMSTPVPGPVEDFSAFLQNITTTLDRLTTQANSLPFKSDLAFHKTLDRTLGKDVDVAGKDVLGLTEKLLDMVEGSGRKLSKGKGRMKVKEEEDLVEGYKRSMGEVVEGLLEDAVSGQYR
jgi:hypothetical protein